MGLAALPAKEHCLWSTVPCLIRAEGRGTADSPWRVLPAGGVGTHPEDGLGWALPLTGGCCDLRLPASSELQFPHLENREINT